MRRLAIPLAVFAQIALAIIATADDDPSVARTWRDRTGEYEVQATLVHVDTDRGVVSLRKTDGEEVSVPLDRLSWDDRSYVTDYLRSRAETGRDNTASAGQSFNDPPRSDLFNVVSLYGVQWHRTPQSAESAANGQSGKGDDKPIMWFRVLGDLAGYM